MHIILEQLGLAGPERWTWALKDRYAVTGFTNPCPAGIQYIVINRNFDPITWGPTNTVNNNVYGYFIGELCKNDPAPESDAYEIGGDSHAVAETFYVGGFYTGLTWDDVGGLRYLLSSNNINTETPAAGSFLQNYDFNAQQLLSTTNYFDLALASRFTPPAALQALFPGLVISSVSNYFALEVTATITSYQTNLPGSPYGSLENVVIVGQVTNIVQHYVYTFGNVVATIYSTNTPAILQTITVAPANGSPYGSPNITKVTTQNIVVTNVASGDYYLFPAGSCGYNFVQTLQTNVVAVTNNLITVVNGTLSLTQNLITHFTNHVYVVAPCSYVTPTTGLYEGVERIQFIHADFDSLIGQTFSPITNTYTMTVITNSQAVKQTFRRVVTQPDFVFATADLDPGGEARPAHFSYARNINFDQANIYGGLAGPGTINPATTVTFNKYGPIFVQQASEDTNTVFTDASQSAIIRLGIIL